MRLVRLWRKGETDQDLDGWIRGKTGRSMAKVGAVIALKPPPGKERGDSIVLSISNTTHRGWPEFV